MHRCGYEKSAAAYAWLEILAQRHRRLPPHQAGVSVCGKVVANEIFLKDEDLEDHIVNWPLKWPKGAKR